MDELIFAGNKYISSKRAGRMTGYTTDYLGQLCRADKIDCRFVGRNWYINEKAINEQKKDFKKEQLAENIRTIEYKKIELEPMYYRNDARSNNPEIDKIATREEQDAGLGIVNLEPKEDSEENTPVRIIKRHEISVKRYNNPNIVSRTERRIAIRQQILPQQASRMLPMIVAVITSVIILVGILFIAGTLTLEQEIRYSSADKTDIDTSFQIASTIKTLDFKNIKGLFGLFNTN